MSDEQPNAGHAGVTATMPNALDLSGLTVIGVMDAHDGVSALLRSSRGQIARVHVGDEAFGVRVNAIGDDQVLLTDRWGRTQSLALPRS